MRSAQLDLKKYDTDKVTNRYLERYDPILAPLVDRELTLLELGVHRGGSVLLWRDYFPRARIVGIDLRLPADFRDTERIQLFEGSQSDRAFLSRVASQTAPAGFDIIIDDASHLGELTQVSFWHLFDHHLKPGGLYFVEDWGTGYWDDWPDGRSLDLQQSPGRPARFIERLRALGIRAPNSLKAPMPCHSYGMVGFVKQLVDEQAAPDVTRRLLAGRAGRCSKFESVTILPSIVVIRKAGASPPGSL